MISFKDFYKKFLKKPDAVNASTEGFYEYQEKIREKVEEMKRLKEHIEAIKNYKLNTLHELELQNEDDHNQYTRSRWRWSLENESLSPSSFSSSANTTNRYDLVYFESLEKRISKIIAEVPPEEEFFEEDEFNVE